MPLRGRSPLCSGQRAAARHRLAMACGHAVLPSGGRPLASSLPDAPIRRIPHPCPPLPSLPLAKCLVLLESMTDPETETRSSFIGVEARMEV